MSSVWVVLVHAVILAACAPSSLPIAVPADPPTATVESDAVATTNEPVRDPITFRLARASEASPTSLATLSVRGAAVPLRVESARVAVTIDGRLARTEVTQVFRSALDHASVGHFELVLPRGASLTRLLLEVDGAMVEPEVVDTTATGDRRADPQLPPVVETDPRRALRLEVKGVRLAARATKTLVVVYDELLPTEGGVVVYRFGLPRVGPDASPLAGHFDLELSADPGAGVLAVTPGSGLVLTEAGPEERRGASFTARDFRPSGSLAVALTPRGGLPTRAFAGPSGEGADGPGAPIYLNWVSSTRAPRTDLILALDTSWSIGPTELARAKALIASLVAASTSVRRVTIVHGDLHVATCPNGAVDRCLAGLDSGGASDLAALLTAAVDHAPVDSPSAIILLGDGVPTGGELDPERLARALALRPRARLHAVAVGSLPDLRLLSGLTARGGGELLELGPDRAVGDAVRELMGLLERPKIHDVKVAVVAGEALMVSSAAPRPVRLGDALPLFGRLLRGPVTLELQGELMGENIRELVPIDLASTPNSALVHDAWVQAAKVRRPRAPAGAAARRATPSIPTPVLSVVSEVATEDADDRARPDRIRAAHASGDSGSGHGLGFLPDGDDEGWGFGRIQGPFDDSARPRARRLGHVALATPVTLRGGCDPERIAAVLTRRARHLGSCLDDQLRRRPEGGGGRITLRWAVDADGRGVGVFALGDRTLDERTIACARASLRGWRFEPSDRGVCVVEQGFDLSPGEVFLEDRRLGRVGGQPWKDLIAAAGGDIERTVAAFAVDRLTIETRWAVLVEL